MRKNSGAKPADSNSVYFRERLGSLPSSCKQEELMPSRYKTSSDLMDGSLSSSGARILDVSMI
jgi:hypothetical protein